VGELYLLTFLNGKQYVGVTSTNARRRRIVHLHHARKGRKGALQRAIRKYGQLSFTTQTLVIANDWGYLCDLEQKAIAAFRTRAPAGYNLTNGGEGTLGGDRPPELRKHISEAHKKSGHRPPSSKGYRHTAEAKAKIAAAGKGRVFSAERKSKIGTAKIGNKYALGRVYSEETKRKISESQKGRRMPEERRLRMVGRKRSTETVAKIAAALRGKPWSEARRAAQKTAKRAEQ
jgi:group I intron endonuclease